MNVNGIGTTGYPAWQGARKAQQNAAVKYLKYIGFILLVSKSIPFSP